MKRRFSPRFLTVFLIRQVRHVFVLVIVIVLVLALGLAQQNLNLTMLERDTQLFESIVAQILRQNFTNPFAVTEDPLGAYLQGYGIVVSFHVNINRTKIRMPWGEVNNPLADHSRNRQQQIDLIKDEMVKCLGEYGGTFKQIGGHDKVSIHARIEDKNELDPLKKRTNLVISVSKDDIDLYSMRRISLETFRDRVHVLEY